MTKYHPNERYPAGDYPNQNPGGDGLPLYSAANRELENTELVLWYTFGHNHIPRPEDWPVMPTSCIEFSLKPDGFFDANPAMDVPLPPRKKPVVIDHTRHASRKNHRRIVFMEAARF